MAAQGLQALSAISLPTTVPLACTSSTRRNGSSVSYGCSGASPFFGGSIPVNQRKFSVQLSSYVRRHSAGGAGAGGVTEAALSFFPFLKPKGADREKVKYELLSEIAPLARGVNATEEDCETVDQLCRKLEKMNPTKDPLKSPLINGKWLLRYTTSESILKKGRPAFFRPNGPIYQAINTDTLRAQNLETWPTFNQVTANLEPVSGSKVIVKFDTFKIAGLISIKAPGRARGELDITYLDEELRIARGDKGNLFVLTMDDPDYRVPV